MTTTSNLTLVSIAPRDTSVCPVVSEPTEDICIRCPHREVSHDYLFGGFNHWCKATQEELDQL